MILSNGNRSGETPKPIPNLEAKPAHDMCVLPSGGKAYCCLAFLFILLLDSMQKEDDKIPAWLLCEDILNRIKTELITQAMDTLQEAIDSKAIEITGSLVNLPDKPSDTEMKMFIIGKLIENRDDIVSKYGDYLSKEDNDPRLVQQKERLKKFILAVEQISLLMQYSRLFDPWMHDAGMQVESSDALDVMRRTMQGSDERIEAMRYVLKNRKLEKEKILKKSEREILESAVSGIN